MKIYVIGGAAKSGKNTFGTYLREEAKKYGYKPCVMQITEPLYCYARTYFDWDFQNGEKPREFLQKMGIEIIKNKLKKETFLLDRIAEDIEILSNFFDVFIITDARLAMEFQYFKRNYSDVVTIRLSRKQYDNGLSEEEKNHITEQEIQNLKDFDYEIENISLESLKRAAQEIVEQEETKGDII